MPIPPSSPASSATRFWIISVVMVGSWALTRRRIAIMLAISFWAASWPGPSLRLMKEPPSYPMIAQERVPVPFLPQLAVRPRSSAIARSIRSPW